MARRNKDARYSVFDAMEANGVFDENPANASADQERDGVKFRTFPVRYPKMFYHPKGEVKITRQAEAISTPIGPKFVNERKEMISALAQDEADEKKLRDAGWHDHPSKALAAAGLDAPAISPAQTISDLQGEIARLQARLNSESAQQLNGDMGSKAAGPVTAAKALASAPAKEAAKAS